MTRRITTAVVSAAIAVSAFAPAGASARVAANPPIGATPAEALALPSPSAGGGFQWGDAGVGAAGALVLVAAFGGASGLRRRAVQG